MFSGYLTCDGSTSFLVPMIPLVTWLLMFSPTPLGPMVCLVPWVLFSVFFFGSRGSSSSWVITVPLVPQVLNGSSGPLVCKSLIPWVPMAPPVPWVLGCTVRKV